jgi:integrase
MAHRIVPDAATRPALELVPAPPTLRALVPDWLAEKRAAGHRPRGIGTYRDIFLRFVTFAGDVPVTAYTARLIKQYRRDLTERGLQASTVRHTLTVLRSFGAFLVEEGYLAENVALKVAHPKVSPPDPDPLQREQIATLLAVLDRPHKSHKYTWRRNRRAVCLMLYAGLRLAEAAGLEWRDIDLSRRTLTIRREVAKGGRPRVLPICDELAAELSAAARRDLSWAVVDHGDRLDKQGEPLGLKSLAHLFERRLPCLLGFPIHAHQLRKTFATELYLRGEDLVTIQRLLGHADPKTTMRYIGASAAKECAAVARLTFRAEQPDPATITIQPSATL